jgi:ribosomal protein S18 acetylase RimI-like enzyme
MEEIYIRKARPEDSPEIAQFINLAMGDIIMRFIGEHSEEKALRLMEKLVRDKGNQYSYENCHVAEQVNEIVAAACVYNGADLHRLREPVALEIQKRFGLIFHPEDETQSGEYYIDCVGVAPGHQGKGIGTKLFRYLMDEFTIKRGHILGLLVDKENPEAKRLYIKLGFKLAGEKTLAGKPMEHYQFATHIQFLRE